MAYLSVFFAVFAQPAVGFCPAVWFFAVPLFFLIRDLPNLRTCFLWGLWIGGLIAADCVGWLWHSMTFFWNFPSWTALLTYLAVVLMMGIQFAVILAGTRWVLDRTGLPFLLMAPLCYILVEYWIPIPFPMQLAMAAVWTPIMLQLVDLSGTAGLSFALVLVNTFFFLMIDGWLHHRPRWVWIGALGVALMLGTAAGYGWIQLHRYTPADNSPPVQVAVIQPMSPLKIMNADHETKARASQTLLSMSRDAVTSTTVRPDLLVWPEGAGPFSYTTPEFNSEFIQAIRKLQEETPVAMTVQDVEFVPGEAPGKIRYYNHVSAIGPGGVYEGGYRKNLLLPFAEYLPGERMFPWLRTIFPEARSSLHGEQQTLLPGPGGPFAPLICYEILSPAYVRRFVNQGARYIVNLTNDQWYGPGAQPIQHLSFAVFRAVENRRPVIRATNSGISALIDARGVIPPGDRTGVMEKAILSGAIHPRDGQTLYARWGDWLPRWLLTPAFLVLLGHGLWTSHRNYEREATSPPSKTERAGKPIRSRRRGRRRAARADPSTSSRNGQP